MLAAFALALTLVAPERPEKLVIVSWDGGADWVMDRLLREGKLPNVAKMAETGMSAEATIPAFPSKTAVSHFSIFSGTWPNRHGVSGNTAPLLPRSQHTILETQSGFDGSQHQTEPLWVTFAKAKLGVATMSAAGSYPPRRDMERLEKAGVRLGLSFNFNGRMAPPKEGRFVGFDGFSAQVSPTRVITEFERKEADVPGPVTNTKRTVLVKTIECGSDRLLAQALDDPNDPVQGYDTVEIVKTSPNRAGLTEVGPRIRLKPIEADGQARYFSEGIQVDAPQGSGITAFRLFSLDPKTGKMVLYQRPAKIIGGTERPDFNLTYASAYGGFHDDAFGVYSRGEFGPTLASGGNGVAEKRVLECVRQDLEYLRRSFRFGFQMLSPDVLFHYTPNSDAAGHCWMGLLDPDLPGHDPVLAAKIWPYYEQVFVAQDEWLGDMMKVAGPKTAFALVSDHGMQGIRYDFFVNRALERAGLCAYDAQGNLDLKRTKVCAPPYGDFFVVANTVDRKGGIVPLSQKESVLKQAERVLLAVRDSVDKPVVTRTIWPKDAPDLGLGGPAGGDLYLDFQYGYGPRNGRNDQLILDRKPGLNRGGHGFWPKGRKMQGIFYLSGPGVPHESLGLVPVVNIAPTLTRLMGVPPSSDFQGRSRLK